MTASPDHSVFKALLETAVRQAAREVFNWAAGAEQAPVHAFEPRLRQAILDKLEGNPAVGDLTVRIDDTRLGYEGGSFTRVCVTLHDEIVFDEMILLDEAAGKLRRMMREPPRRRFGAGAE